MFNKVCWLSHAQVVKKSSITQFMEDTFKEKFLFQWGKSGINDWRSLKSVAEPNMFLCVEKEKGKGKEKVTINSVEEPSFQIKTGILSNVCNFYI